jgi:hypothetical protein
VGDLAALRQNPRPEKRALAEVAPQKSRVRFFLPYGIASSVPIRSVALLALSGHKQQEENGPSTKKGSKTMLVRLLLVSALIGAIAHTLPAHADTIYACINNSSGTIKIVGQADVCPTGASKASWSNAPTDVYTNESLGPTTIDGGPVVTLTVPAGKYLVFGQVQEFGSLGVTSVGCSLVNLGSGAFFSEGIVGSEVTVTRLGTLSVIGTTEVVVPLGQPAGDISLSCSTGSDQPVKAFDMKLIAHAVGAIHPP